MDWQHFWRRAVELAAQLRAGVAALTGGSWLAYAVSTLAWTAVGVALGFALG